MTKDIAESPQLRFDPSGAAYVLDPARPVLAHGRDLAAGAHVAPHAHPRGQLLWAAEGLLRLSAGEGVWLVPPGFGIWIPGGTRHEMRVVSRPGTGARTRNLYVDPSFPLRPGAQGGAQGCEVLPVAPLLREVILRMVEETDPARLARLGAVALDEIAAARPAPLDLPAGHDKRLRRLTAHLGRNPADPRPLPVLAAEVGASPRTLARLFRAETGLSFRDWRVRVRLLAAVGRLERGESSTTIAHSLGWRSPSAFVAAFRSHFGSPPQSWLRGRG